MLVGVELALSETAASSGRRDDASTATDGDCYGRCFAAAAAVGGGGGGRGAPPWPQLPMRTLVELRELVARQEGFRAHFRAFAPPWAAAAYEAHRRRACVSVALRMRTQALRPLRAVTGLPIALDDEAYAEAAARELALESSTTVLGRAPNGTHGGAVAEDTPQSSLPLSSEAWFLAHTCRIDHMEQLATELAA